MNTRKERAADLEQVAQQLHKTVCRPEELPEKNTTPRAELQAQSSKLTSLEDAIRRGILQKPRQHHLGERPSDTPRTMNQIGG